LLVSNGLAESLHLVGVFRLLELQLVHREGALRKAGVHDQNSDQTRGEQP
jgi:hypothetical protein